MAKEFYVPKETLEPPKEYSSQYISEMKIHRDEFGEEPENKAEPKPESLTMRMKKMAYLVAASASVVTIGYASVSTDAGAAKKSESGYEVKADVSANENDLELTFDE